MKWIIALFFFSCVVANAMPENCDAMWAPSSEQTGAKLAQVCAQTKGEEGESCVYFEGGDALNFLKEIWPGGTRAIQHLPLIDYKSFGRGEEIAPHAYHVRMSWASRARRASDLVLEWLDGYKTRIHAGHTLPLELTVFTKADGYGVELWLDSSHRRFQSSKNLTVLFDRQGYCQGFEFSRFHFSARRSNGHLRAELRRVKQSSVRFLESSTPVSSKMIEESRRVGLREGTAKCPPSIGQSRFSLVRLLMLSWSKRIF